MIRLVMMLSLGFFMAANAADKTIDSGREWYEVISVKGSVLTRRPQAATWWPLAKRDKIETGQMIQVTSGAKVILKQRAAPTTNKQTQLGADQLTLIIMEPVVFRIGPDILRQVRLSEHYLSKIPASEAVQDKKESLPLFLDEAWERAAAIYERFEGSNEPLSKFALDEVEKRGTAMALTSKRLKILTPAANSLIQSAKFPAELKIAWSTAPVPASEYKVYLWPINASRAAPVAVTKEDHHSLTLYQARSYFVQVTTADGAWRTPAITLHMASSALAATTPQTAANAWSQSSLQHPAVAIDFPPRRYEVTIAERRQASLDFYWRSPVKGPSLERILIRPVGGSKDQAWRIRGGEGRKATTLLAPGVYRWEVEVLMISKRRRTILRSEAREIIVKREAAPLARGLLKRLLQPGIKGTFMLSEGL